MGDRRRQLAQRRHPRHVRQFRLRPVAGPLRARLRSVRSSTNATPWSASPRTSPRRSARARGCRLSGRYSFSNGCRLPVALSSATSCCVALAPFRRASAPSSARVAKRDRHGRIPRCEETRHWPQNSTFEVANDDPDDVGVDQAPDSSLRVLRDRGTGGYSPARSPPARPAASAPRCEPA